MDWRNDPDTLKQLAYIAEMREFSEYELPPFTGKTKGQAADYINKYIKLAHTNFNDLYHDNAGDRI